VGKSFELGTYQEDDRDVQEEGAQAVEEKGDKADVVDLLHGAAGHLPDDSDDEVHQGADGCEVVQRDERVHLVVGGAEEALDHGQAESLEDDTSNLVDDANPDELDLADGCDDDTDDDDRDVQENPQVGGGDTQRPASDEDRDGRGGLASWLATQFSCQGASVKAGLANLKHLNEGDREVEVGQVAADQTQAEKDTNGDNCADVDPAGHLDRLAAIEEGGPVGKDLGHQSREEEVVRSQDDGVACVASVWSAKSVFGEGAARLCISGALRKLRVSRIHLLNRMTEEDKLIQTLKGRMVSQLFGAVAVLRVATHAT
jgi:hypothetical protein